jgi:hypothetical protein
VNVTIVSSSPSGTRSGSIPADRAWAPASIPIGRDARAAVNAAVVGEDVPTKAVDVDGLSDGYHQMYGQIAKKQR